MTLLWAVPVVGAAVATLLVVARARALEDEVVGLVADVRALRAVREPMRGIRAMTAETDALVADFRGRHPLDEGETGGPTGVAAAAGEAEDPDRS